MWSYHQFNVVAIEGCLGPFNIKRCNVILHEMFARLSPGHLPSSGIYKTTATRTTAPSKMPIH